MRQDSVLNLSGIVLRFGDRVILEDTRLDLRRGRSASIVGRSGSGKTTLGLAILGLLPVQAGTILVGGESITSSNSKRRRRIRQNRIGTVFQGGELLVELSAHENVSLPALLSGRGGSASKFEATSLLDAVGLTDHARPVATYSGGEKQRIAVARALINNPDLILADEPTGSLDHATSREIQDLLLSMPAIRGCALLFVTHDLAFAKRADNGFALSEGRLHELSGS